MSDKEQSNQTTQDNIIENEPKSYTKSDYIRAKAIINSYKEAQKTRPKRKCSEKQLAALAAGRDKARANREARKAAAEK